MSLCIYICIYMYIYIDIETFAYIGSFKPRVHCTMFNLFSLCQDPSVFSEPLWHVAHNVLFDCVHLQSQTENVVNSIEVTIYPTTYMQVNQNRKQPDPNPRAFSATCSRPLQQKVTIQWTKIEKFEREDFSPENLQTSCFHLAETKILPPSFQGILVQVYYLRTFVGETAGLSQ